MGTAPGKKREFYRRHYAGEFGNRNFNWPTLEEFMKSGYRDPVAVRAMTPGGVCTYDIPADDVERVVREKYPGQDINISDMLHSDRIVLQGEGIGRELFYSTVRKPMRPALAEGGRHASGLLTECLLRTHLNDCSYADMQEVREWFPDAAIEFTAYDRKVGILPYRNAVIWEVRMYSILWVLSAFCLGLGV